MFNILIAILIINIVIFVHELGHFLVAKALGVDVYEFSIGFGPKLIQFKKNETLYTLRAIPLLGHVLFDDIEGIEKEIEKNNELENDKTENNIVRSENHLKNKGYFTELAVYLAGPLFNFLTAFLVLCVVYTLSGFPSTTVKESLIDSPAYEAGITQGDTILEINNIKISNWSDISNTINKLKKDTIQVKVKKEDNSIKELNVKTKYDKESNFYSIGISPEFKFNLFKAITNGFANTIDNIQYHIKTVSELIMKIFIKDGNSSEDIQLSGPIGAIHNISEESKKSSSSLIPMFVALNINIGVMNLIPFVPVLDGGQATLITLEAIFRRKISENTLLSLKLAGAIALIGLMIFTTFKDILTII